MLQRLFVLFIFSFAFCLNCPAQMITISAIGDIMSHLDLQEYALAHSEGYQVLFKNTAHIFHKDDLTIANLETPVCDQLPISGYPRFNARESLLKAIKQAGIDMLSLANNHSFDQAYQGVSSTVQAAKDNHLLYSGMGQTVQTTQKIKYVKIKNFLIGYISLTFSVNGLAYRDKEKLPAINLVAMNDQEKIDQYCALIRREQKNADLIIVSYHCGREYTSIPIEQKKKVLQKFAEAGARIILSHHPHVLQKAELYQTRQGREALIAYSLGNFISAQTRYASYLTPEKYQKDFIPIKTAEAAILQFDLVRWNGQVKIIRPRIIPLFNITFKKTIKGRTYTGFATIPIQDLLEKDPAQNGLPYLRSILKKMVQYRGKKIKETLSLPAVRY